LTSAFLDGRNLVLGSPSGNFARLGPASTSTSVGAGFNLNLGNGFQLGFDAALAQTDATQSGSYLYGTATSLSGSAVSLALSKANLIDDQDSLDVVLKKPLSMGLAGGDLVVPTGGDALMKSLKKTIAPAGSASSETNLGVGYSRPIVEGLDGRINF